MFAKSCSCIKTKGLDQLVGFLKRADFLTLHSTFCYSFLSPVLERVSPLACITVLCSVYPVAWVRMEKTRQGMFTTMLETNMGKMDIRRSSTSVRVLHM